MTSGTTGHTKFSHVRKWLIAGAIIGGGVYLSIIEFMGREWLSRAGCLIVMLGIWSGLGGIVRERMLAGRIRSKQRNALVHARAKLSEDNVNGTSLEDDALNAELEKIRDSFEAQLSHAAEKLRMSVGVEEVSLVLTGTLIWGFGDLIFG